MAKPNINTILKNGDQSKAVLVDYTSPEKKKELQKLKKQSEKGLRNGTPSGGPPIIIKI